MLKFHTVICPGTPFFTSVALQCNFLRFDPAAVITLWNFFDPLKRLSHCLHDIWASKKGNCNTVVKSKWKSSFTNLCRRFFRLFAIDLVIIISINYALNSTYLDNILVLPFRSDGRLVRISEARGYLWWPHDLTTSGGSSLENSSSKWKKASRSDFFTLKYYATTTTTVSES